MKTQQTLVSLLQTVFVRVSIGTISILLAICGCSLLGELDRLGKLYKKLSLKKLIQANGLRGTEIGLLWRDYTLSFMLVNKNVLLKIKWR